jgi:IS5 family transposase
MLSHQRTSSRKSRGSKQTQRHGPGLRRGAGLCERRETNSAGHKAFEGNPYDGHTLKATIDQAEAMTGVKVERAYADKGYKGHDYEGPAQVMLSGRKRGLTPTMKRELKRRSAIEPMIGHAKNDGRLGRNYLLGQHGDKINALLAAAGHNLRLILNKLRLLFAWILIASSGTSQNQTLGRDFQAFKKQPLSRFSGRTNDVARWAAKSRMPTSTIADRGVYQQRGGSGCLTFPA